jgi:hypothetical protein
MKAEAVKLNDPEFKDKDGSDDDIGLTDVHIEFATNGYMVTYSYDDGSEKRAIYTDFNELLADIRTSH